MMRGGKPSRARVAPHDQAVDKGGVDPLTGCIAFGYRDVALKLFAEPSSLDP